MVSTLIIVVETTQRNTLRNGFNKILIYLKTINILLLVIILSVFFNYTFDILFTLIKFVNISSFILYELKLADGTIVQNVFFFALRSCTKNIKWCLP
jgi:hypothetical protein